jgi:hypothetical protein
MTGTAKDRTKTAIAGDLMRGRCGPPPQLLPLLFLMTKVMRMMQMQMVTTVAMMVVAEVTLTTVTALHGLSLPIEIVWRGRSMAPPILLHWGCRNLIVPKHDRDSAACPSSPHTRPIMWCLTHLTGMARTRTLWSTRIRSRRTIYNQLELQQRYYLLGTTKAATLTAKLPPPPPPVAVMAADLEGAED